MGNEGNLLAKRILISKDSGIEDAIIEVLISKEEFFELVIEEIPDVVFKFKHGRFDEEFVPISVLKIARVYRTSLKKYFKATLNGEPPDDTLYFKIERGSLGIDFQQLLEQFMEKAVGKMTGVEISVVLLLALLVWASRSSFSEYLDSEKEKLKTRLIEENNGKMIGVLEKAVDALRQNTSAEAAKNTPPRKAIEMLEDGETLEYGSVGSLKEFTPEDADIFEIPEEPLVRYETIIDNFHVKKISEKDGKILVTLKNRKYKSFQAISKLSSNEPLLAAMEACESIKLKVSIGSDSNGEVVEADIYEIING